MKDGNTSRVKIHTKSGGQQSSGFQKLYEVGQSRHLCELFALILKNAVEPTNYANKHEHIA